MTKTDDVKEFMLAMDQEVRDEAGYVVPGLEVNA